MFNQIINEQNKYASLDRIHFQLVIAHNEIRFKDSFESSTWTRIHVHLFYRNKDQPILCTVICL